MSTIKRSHIYIIVSFFIIAFCITNSHIELEHIEVDNIENQNNKIENLEEYNKLEILYPLEIKNYQNDNKVISYNYKIKVEGISGAYKYKYKDCESYMVFTANGESQFTLESNESIIIYDLPENAKYEIDQLTDVSNEYTTKIDDEYKTKTTGTIKSLTTLAFDNETIKEVVPNQKEENPYTKDSYYFVIIIAAFALLICYIGKNYKIKRFE